jgi:hypothetical protein
MFDTKIHLELVWLELALISSEQSFFVVFACIGQFPPSLA